MTILLGPADMKQFALPSGVDGDELSKWRLADGTTFDTVLSLLLSGLSVVSSDLVAHPIWGSLMSPTTEQMVEYIDGTTNGMEARTEYRRADSRRGATEGHHLPLKSYDRGLGWTEDFLEKARMMQIDADIQSALYDVWVNFPRRLLQRFTNNSYYTVASSGKDAPLVDGTTGTIDYTPPPYMGKTFANTHNHFDRKGTTNQADALAAGALHLWEHGIMAPYNALVPEADIATYTTLGNFVKPDRGLTYVNVANSNAPYAQRADAFQDDLLIGFYETDYGMINLYQTALLPTAYLSMWKSYGALDQRNPCRVRFNPFKGLGAILKADPDSNTPLVYAYILHEFGVGIGNRLNGYNCYFFASGNYVNPTIN